MNINHDKVIALKPCADRYNNFKSQYPAFNADINEFVHLDNITYSDKVWVVTRLFTKEQNVAWSIMCAESTLENFERVYPDDKRPRLALEAAKTGVGLSAAITAARSAAWSAWSAESAWSARSAAESARSAAESARSAAESARSAAESAAEKEQETKNLSFMLIAAQASK